MDVGVCLRLKLGQCLVRLWLVFLNKADSGVFLRSQGLRAVYGQRRRHLRWCEWVVRVHEHRGVALCLVAEVRMEIHEHRLVCCLHALRRALIPFEPAVFLRRACCVRVVVVTHVKRYIAVGFRRLRVLTVCKVAFLGRWLAFVNRPRLAWGLLSLGMRLGLLHFKLFGDETVLDYLVNVLSLPKRSLIVQVKKAHLAAVGRSEVLVSSLMHTGSACQGGILRPVRSGCTVFPAIAVLVDLNASSVYLVKDDVLR